MKAKVYLLLCFALFDVVTAIAQVPFFQEYYPLKRSQPVQVNALLQDSRGFIWLGTNQGLFRFDGLAFNHYTNTDSAVDIRVTALAEDSLGRVWTGHHSGHLSYLDNGELHLFVTEEGPAAAPVSDILFDRRGNLWFSTMNDGLYYFIGDRLYRIDEEEGLPDLFVYDLYEDAVGRIWAGTDGGIARCTLADRNVTLDNIDSDDGLPDIIIKKIKPLDEDTLLLATEDAGILKYDTRTDRAVPLDNADWTYGSISDFTVKESQLWIACPRRGLIVYDRVTQQFKALEQHGSLNLRSVNALLKDREGNIWSGSRTGISRTMGDAVEHIESLEPSRSGNVLAVAVDQEGSIWFSTSEGLFVRRQSAVGDPVVIPMLRNTQFARETIISLYADDQGSIWAGLYGNGLLRMDRSAGQLQHFGRELRNGNVLDITGRDGVVWIATLGGASSIRQEADGQYVVRNYSSEDGLSSDYIYQVLVDSRDRVWFATDGRGVSMLDDRGFHHFADGLGSKVIYSVVEDADQNIWVSAQDNGVYLFARDRFNAVPELRLRDNAVQAFAADNRGHVIAVHNYGVDVYDVKHRKMRYFGEESGIRDKHPNLNAVAKDKHGQLYFGTSKGIVKFSLYNDEALTLPTPVIEKVTVYGEPIDIAKLSRLSYNANNITIHYLGFWYQNTGALNYLYRLENYDLQWIPTRDLDVTYSRLPPGDYVFRVKVSDTEDFTHATESTFTFSISPPFWRTTPFYFLAVALFFIGGYTLIKFRERNLLEAKLVLEAKVEERTREIQQKTEEIQAQNEEIQAQAEEIQGINENLEMLVQQRTAELEKKNKALEEYAFINAHKLRGPVASILGLLNLLAKAETKEEDAKLIREHLYHSAEKLDTVVRSITKAIENADNKYPS